MLHTNFMVPCFIEPELLTSEDCGNRDFQHNLLLLWPWPWSDDFHMRTWPVLPEDIYRMYKYELPTSRLSKVIAWQTDKQTDMTEIIYHAAYSRVVNYAVWNEWMNKSINQSITAEVDGLIDCGCNFSHNYGRRAFSVAGPTIWNWLPDSMIDPAISRDSFRRSLKTFLFSAYLCSLHSALELSRRCAL